MLRNNIIVKKLAKKALEGSIQKEELKVICIEQTEKAFQCWDNDYYQKAISEINVAIKFFPKLPFLQLLKSLFYCSAKNTKESESIVNLFKDNELSAEERNIKYFIKSCNSAHEKRFHDAINYSNEIIKKNKNAYYAYLPRAISFQELDEQKKAIKDFKVALKEELQIKGIKAALAFSYMKNKNYYRAILLHLRVIKYFKNNFRVNHNIGLNFVLINFVSKGLKYVNKSIELKSDFADAYRTRGLIYFTQGKKEDAILEFEKARKYGAKGIDKTMKRFNLIKE